MTRRVPTRQEPHAYLYLLMEFQSTTDWWMAVRTQYYQGLLLQQIARETKLPKGARLPPLLLLVLYNGKDRWDAPTQITDLIELHPDAALWHLQPQVRYYLLDMGAFAGDDLAQRNSLVALLFRLEQRCLPQQLEVLIEEVNSWFLQHPGFADLMQLFRELIQLAIRSTGTRIWVPEELWEMRSNLATIGTYWKEQWRAEAKVEAKAEDLVCLLEKKFPVLPLSVRERVRGADLATVERWFVRAIDARDLASVFE